MKIKSLRIKNFRGYYDENCINFDDLTVLVGKNDVGKSTVLEALDVFFNDGKGVVKLDKDDLNKKALAEGDNLISISVTFEELPASVVIDSSNSTTLEGEFLLNNSGCLEITKKYSNAGAAKVFIKANHPNNLDCFDLLLKKNPELKKFIQAKGIVCSNHSVNAIMREYGAIMPVIYNWRKWKLMLQKEILKIFGKNYKPTCHYTLYFNQTVKIATVTVKFKTH